MDRPDTPPNHAAPPVRLVVFDAGGVIVRLGGPWEPARTRAGVPANERYGTPEFEALVVGLADRHQLGQIESESYVEAVARAGGLTAGEVEAILGAWISDEYPGWNDVVERLERAGLETALLSNTNAFHWEYLVPEGSKAGRYPAIGRLHHRFASHQLGMVKPNPEIYRTVDRVTGRRGAEILFFDDLAPNVAAARAIGWRAVQIDPTGDPARQVLDALDEAGV